MAEKSPAKRARAINITISAVFGVCLFFLIITVSIGLPIYLRFFYYLQIDSLGLESTGYTYEQIKQAYDEVLNFLTLPGVPFGTGVLNYTEEGAAHFYDCKVLFNLNAGVLISCAAVCITVLILHKKKVITLCRPHGFSVGFYSAVCAVLLPIIIGALAATDFDRAFVIFHRIFFPGKDNWIFDPDKDEIIQILPQEYFMNCAILIGAGLIAICAGIIIAACVKRARAKRAAFATAEAPAATGTDHFLQNTGGNNESAGTFGSGYDLPARNIGSAEDGSEKPDDKINTNKTENGQKK